jgi:hypothetical protein
VMWNWQSITRHEVLTFKEHKKNISLFFYFEKKNSRRRPSMKASKENKEWKANKLTRCRELKWPNATSANCSNGGNSKSISGRSSELPLKKPCILIKKSIYFN